MNPDAPKNLRAELEARLTSLLLGELGADDAELLRKLIAHDPELAKLHGQLKLTIELVGETARGAAEAKAESAAPLKLSAERREKLLAQFKTVQPKEFVRPARRSSLARVAVAVAAVFVLLGVLATLFLPHLARRTEVASFVPSSLTDEGEPASAIRLAPLGSTELASRRSVELEKRREGAGTVMPAKGAGEAQSRAQSAPAETLRNSAVAPSLVPSRTTIVLPSSGDAASASATPFATAAYLFNLKDAPPSPVAGPATTATPPPRVRGEGEIALGSKLLDSPAKDAKEQRAFHLNYADPASTATLLSGLFPGQNGSQSLTIRDQSGNSTNERFGDRKEVVAVADPRLSSVVVTAPSDRMDKIAEMISDLDHPGKQVAMSVVPLANGNRYDVMQALQDTVGTTTTRNTQNQQRDQLTQRIQTFQNLYGTSSASTSSGLGKQLSQAQDNLDDSKVTTMSGLQTQIQSADIALHATSNNFAVNSPAPNANSPLNTTAAGGRGGRRGAGRGVGQIGGPINAPELTRRTGGSSIDSLQSFRDLDSNALAQANRGGRFGGGGGFGGGGFGGGGGGGGIGGPRNLGEEARQRIAPGTPRVSVAGGSIGAGGSGGGFGGRGVAEGVQPNTQDLYFRNSGSGEVAKDRVPVLGDIPITGRLFRAESTLSTNPASGFAVRGNNQIEFLGYDDPGQFGIQAQSAGGATSALQPLTAQLPLPRFRVSLPDGTTTNVSGPGAYEVQKALQDGTSGRNTRNTANTQADQLRERLQNQYGANDRSKQQVESRSPIYVPATNTAGEYVSVDNQGNLVLMADEMTIGQMGQTIAPNTETMMHASEQAVNMKPGADAKTHVQNGKMLYEMGRWEEAENELKLALKQDPNNTTALAYNSMVQQAREKTTLDRRTLAGGGSQVQVVESWNPTERELLQVPNPAATNRLINLNQGQRIVSNLWNLRLDTVGPWDGLPLSEVARVLTDEARRRGMGISFMVNPNQPGTPSQQVDVRNVKISLPKQSSITFGDLLNTITTAADHQLAWSPREWGVVFSMNAPGTSVEQKSSGSDEAPPKPAIPPPIPQPEILTRENAFSTFSLNVSDVSFKLAAASLEKGQIPEPASIRSEEFINAFDYRDPEAAPGTALAFTSERAAYPFAHNRDLLRFSIKTAAAGRAAGRPLNLVLLLDNSGSMERADRVSILREALRVLASQLHANDTLSVITFSRTPRLWVDGLSGDHAAEVADGLSELTPQGGTNLGDAMNLAYATALRHYLANGINRVVLLTDGAANLGDVDANSLKQKVEANRKQGIALDCFGIGWEGYNDDLLEVLTRNGDGRYGFLNSPEEAATEFAAQLAGALQVAASDVKVQVEFNPNRVTSYRQIGYAKHQLTKEQFRDNTVDAAEIAAQEAGNALYTIETNPNGNGPIATVHVRYRIPGGTSSTSSEDSYREQAWDVPYTGTAVALEQSTPAMRLAATACAFSEWLATSPFAAEVTPDALLKILNGVPGVYGADKRPEKLEWMIRQAKSITGK